MSSLPTAGRPACPEEGGAKAGIHEFIFDF